MCVVLWVPQSATCLVTLTLSSPIMSPRLYDSQSKCLSCQNSSLQIDSEAKTTGSTGAHLNGQDHKNLGAASGW